MAIQFLRENVHWRSQSLQQPIKAGKIMISSGNYPGLIALIDGINCRTSSHCRWAFDCIWIPDITVSGPLSQPLPDKPLTINNQKSHALPGQQALHRFVHLRFITHESTTAWCFFYSFTNEKMTVLCLVCDMLGFNLIWLFWYIIFFM